MQNILAQMAKYRASIQTPASNGNHPVVKTPKSLRHPDVEEFFRNLMERQQHNAPARDTKKQKTLHPQNA